MSWLACVPSIIVPATRIQFEVRQEMFGKDCGVWDNVLQSLCWYERGVKQYIDTASELQLHDQHEG